MNSELLEKLLNQERQAYKKFLETCQTVLDAEEQLQALHSPISHNGGKPHDKISYHQDVLDACNNFLGRENYQARLRRETE